MAYLSHPGKFLCKAMFLGVQNEKNLGICVQSVMVASVRIQTTNSTPQTNRPPPV